MDSEPIQPIIPIGTMPNNYGVKNGHGLKNVTCEQTLTQKINWVFDKL